MNFIERLQWFVYGGLAGFVGCAVDVWMNSNEEADPTICLVEVHNVGPSNVTLVDPNETEPFDRVRSSYLDIEPEEAYSIPVKSGDPTIVAVACGQEIW